MMTFVNGGGSGKTANKGSSIELAMYGEHENMERGLSNRLGTDDAKCLWFDADKTLTAEEVAHKIDNNRKGLKKEEAKFYEIEICPSAKEQKAMFANCGTDAEREKVFTEYIRNHVIEDYAQNFKGYKGKEFHSENICWAGVIHTARTKSPEREENWHAHIVVSHRTADMKNSISPKKNQRGENKGMCQGYFDRTEWIIQNERTFDKVFAHERNIDETFERRNEAAKGVIKLDFDKIEKAAIQLYHKRLAEAKENRLKEEKEKAEQRQRMIDYRKRGGRTEQIQIIENGNVISASISSGANENNIAVRYKVNGRDYTHYLDEREKKKVEEKGGVWNLQKEDIATIIREDMKGRGNERERDNQLHL